MDIDKIRNEPVNKKLLRNKLLTIRVSQNVKSWLALKDYGATKIFYEAIKELGYDAKEDYVMINMKETTSNVRSHLDHNKRVQRKLRKEFGAKK